MESQPILQFWFEFASTYSYLSAMRIEVEAAKAGVIVAWRPFLLGPIFAAKGWATSPFNLDPAKGRHMWRDVEREAAALGLPFRRPEPFPQNGLLAARVASLGAEAPWGPAFVRAVYAAEFGEGRPIADPETVADIVGRLGLDPDRVLADAGSDVNKATLRARTEEAARLGIFGAPSFVAPDGDLFWGNDRLGRALARAAAHPA